MEQRRVLSSYQHWLAAACGSYTLGAKMTLPEMTDLEGKFAVLERIAESFPVGSVEREAIYAAAHAMN